MKTSFSLATTGFISLLCFSQPNVADTVRTVWRVEGLSQYDYVSGQYVTPTVPTSVDVTIDFPAEVGNVTDFGTTTITYFGGYGDTVISSPLTQFVGADPYGGGVSAGEPYTYPNVSDITSAFVENFSAQSVAYSPSGSRFWNWHVAMIAQRYSASRGGTGNADYAFTTATILDFLEDVKSSPQSYWFNFFEYWQEFDRDTGASLAGTGWSSGNARLMSVSVIKDVDPLAMFDALVVKVTGVGPGSSIADKATLAMTYYQAGDGASACGMLDDISWQVSALKGKRHLTTEQGADILGDIDALGEAITCP